jgi:hypothetical protein
MGGIVASNNTAQRGGGGEEEEKKSIKIKYIAVYIALPFVFFCFFLYSFLIAWCEAQNAKDAVMLLLVLF